MPVTLLSTKFYFPPIRESLVSRPRLIERLNQGLQGSLVLISAPPGYGKTTLLSEWQASQARRYPVAWLTLDVNDNDLTSFLEYFISAFKILGPDLGETALSILHSPRPPSTETILTNLINELNKLDQPFALVLDDYHVIETRSIHDALSFLLEHLPIQMHLLILTRADPPLHLAKLRACGQLTEIRVADLRFSMEEAEKFLTRAMRLRLSQQNIADLEQSTEGWIAGLQLAALSMEGRTDIQDFVSAFAGSHHFIVDYLVEEVLNHQSDEIKDFLLKTSILERMNGLLCDALAGTSNGRELLERLEHGNLFVVPLDDEQHWYRYHHLFAELLQNRLRHEYPGMIRELYRQASRWCFLNGLLPEAIMYAIAEGDFEQAALLIEEGIPPMQRRGEFRAISGWLSKLPETVIRTRPRLCISYAWAIAFSSGAPERVEQYLRYAEQVIDNLPTSPVTKDITGQIACIRANVAVYIGDNQHAIELCVQAQRLIAQENTALRSYAALMEADACWMMGDGNAAQLALENAIQLSRTTGDLQTALIGMNYLARLYVAHGSLRLANDMYQQAIRLATELGGIRWLAMGVIYVGLGMLLWEQNDTESAMSYLTDGVELATQADDVDSLLFGYTTLARINQALGLADQALDWAVKAERLADETKLARDRYRLATRQTRLMLAKGDIPAARRWSMELTDSVEEYSQRSALPDISPMRVSEQLIRARVMIAIAELEEALQLITPMLPKLETAGRIRNVIEILVLQALIYQAQGNLIQATTALSRALIIAAPEGFIRLFIDEGEPMAQLLQQIRAESIESKSYIDRLLAAFNQASQTQKTVGIPHETKAEQSIVEPLSGRELEVLHLLAEGCSNREIAEQLFIALGTVKRHTANIFAKLEARNRTEAVARARDLKLI